MTHSGLESTEHTSIEAGDRFLLYSGMTCIVAVPGTWPGTSARLRSSIVGQQSWTAKLLLQWRF
jgi:hypothetical protein